LVAAQFGVERPPAYGPALPGQAHHIGLDPSLARLALGWRATVPLPDGIGRLVRSMRGVPVETCHQPQTLVILVANRNVDRVNASYAVRRRAAHGFYTVQADFLGRPAPRLEHPERHSDFGPAAFGRRALFDAGGAARGRFGPPHTGHRLAAVDGLIDVAERTCDVAPVVTTRLTKRAR
jgi:hypothetical protein